MYKKIPGTRDVLPEEAIWWQKTENLSRSIFALYNYQEVRPPLLEDAGLFNRSLGENTEIVQKQMFLVKNNVDLYALRPEGTASVVRAYIENNCDKTCGLVKWYYLGPMFRLERPQKGRLRQFHHIGCEVIGSSCADLDVEVIALADDLLKGYGISGYETEINTLGCPEDKGKLIELLRVRLGDKLSRLCEDCQRRFTTNPLRILDCKNDDCSAVIAGLDINNQHLCDDCKTHFKQVTAGLDALGVSYEVLPRLVRGLDYYNRTVFEIKHSSLGSQDALGAGGRYNNLVKQLGGPDIGAIGFALGVERLLLVSGQTQKKTPNKLAYIIPLGENARSYSLKLLASLRKAGICCDTDYENRSLKGAMRRANDLAARFVLIIGDDELKNAEITLKDMESGEQRVVKQDSIKAILTT